MKLLFFGSRIHGMETLKAFISQGYEICCVTTEDYNMDNTSSEDFQKLCEENKIDFYKNDKIENDEWADLYSKYEADLGICAGWRRIIGEKIIGTTRHGFIGVHGADLPKYRGFASTHYSILNGDPYCGFCVMKFKPGHADNGDVCSRFHIPINEDTTIKDIMESARPLSIKHLLETAENIKKGTLKLEVQDESEAVYSYPRIPEDGEIDWHKSAIEIDRLIRAVTRPYPGAFTFMDGKKTLIWKARVYKKKHEFVGVPGHMIHIEKMIGVLTGDGIIILEECQFEDGEIFSPGDYFKTYRIRLGMNHSKLLYELRKRVEILEKRL